MTSLKQALNNCHSIEQLGNVFKEHTLTPNVRTFGGRRVKDESKDTGKKYTGDVSIKDIANSFERVCKEQEIDKNSDKAQLVASKINELDKVANEILSTKNAIQKLLTAIRRFFGGKFKSDVFNKASTPKPTSATTTAKPTPKSTSPSANTTGTPEPGDQLNLTLLKTRLQALINQPSKIERSIRELRQDVKELTQVKKELNQDKSDSQRLQMHFPKTLPLIERLIKELSQDKKELNQDKIEAQLSQVIDNMKEEMKRMGTSFSHAPDDDIYTVLEDQHRVIRFMQDVREFMENLGDLRIRN